MTNVAAMLLATTVVLSQTPDSSSPSVHLKHMEWFLGQWQAVVDVPEDATGGASDLRGKTLRVEWSNSWTMNNSFIESRLTVTDTASKEIVFSGLDLWGWDPATRKVSFWFFNSGGWNGRGALRQDGENKFVLEFHGIDADSQVGSTTRVYEVIDRDTMTMHDVEQYLGGVKLESPTKLEFNRVNK